MPDLASMLLGWPGVVVLLVVVWVVGRWESRCHQRLVQRWLDDIRMRRRLQIIQLEAECVRDPPLLGPITDEDRRDAGETERSKRGYEWVVGHQRSHPQRTSQREIPRWLRFNAMVPLLRALRHGRLDLAGVLEDPRAGSCRVYDFTFMVCGVGALKAWWTLSRQGIKLHSYIRDLTPRQRRAIAEALS